MKMEEPGQYPYTRGINADPGVWTMGQYGGFGTPAETNQRFLVIQGREDSSSDYSIKNSSELLSQILRNMVLSITFVFLITFDRLSFKINKYLAPKQGLSFLSS